MAEVNASIEVDVPVSTAYNQWTQFEEFPQFMDNIESVRQMDDGHLHWVADRGGNRDEWTAEITIQEPDQVIAWRSIAGKGTSGEVRFEPMGENRTKVDVTMTWEPEGMTEALGARLGLDTGMVEEDLGRFKQLVENRGQESGAWRGEIVEGERVD
jgi:uncharacterized membrane protein